MPDRRRALKVVSGSDLCVPQGQLLYQLAVALLYQLAVTLNRSSRILSARRLSRLFVSALAAVLLASTLPTHSVSAMPATDGEWSELAEWNFIPIHTFIDEFGRVITYGGTRDGWQGGWEIDIWDPRRGFGPDSHTTVENTLGTNLFCSISLSDVVRGSTLMFGGETAQGNQNSFATEFKDDQLTSASPLQEPRWYPTATTLADGRIVLQGGLPDSWGLRDRPIRVAEIYDPTTATWATLEGTRNAGVWATENFGWWYPRAFATPDGLVWSLAWDQMYYIDPDGEGSVRRLGTFPTSNYGATSAAVMFEPGRVLIAGGGERGSNDQRFIGSNEATIVDLNTNPPTLTPTTNMTYRRHWADAIVLADGKVLVVGGSEVNNADVGVAPSPELWDPDTGQWTVLAPTDTPRLYHSSAALMADGSVFVGGGGAPGPFKNLNAEVFSPPYLFDASGQRQDKPSLSATPWKLSNAQGFSFNADRAIARVTMVKTNNATHSINSQSFHELSFSQNGSSISASAPSNPANATPGLYMLFALDGDGVPSDAAMVWLESNSSVTPPPPPPPDEGANLLANGGFEATTVAAGGYAITTTPGWASSAGNELEIWNNHAGVAPSQGDQIIELNIRGPETISQSVTLSAGATYEWSLDHRGRFDEDTIEVLVDGASQGRFSAQPGRWTTHVGSFVAQSASTTFSVRAIDAGGAGNLIDTVGIRPSDGTPVPPPPNPAPPVAQPSGNLLTNGGFETPNIASGRYDIIEAPGWTSSDQGQVEIWDHLGDLEPTEGDQHIELNVRGPATISQTVRVTPGATYTWSFDHRGRRNRDKIDVFINGALQTRVKAGPNLWKSQSGSIVADTNSLTLTLTAVDSGSVGNFVDNVSLVTE